LCGLVGEADAFGKRTKLHHDHRKQFSRIEAIIDLSPFCPPRTPRQDSREGKKTEKDKTAAKREKKEKERNQTDRKTTKHILIGDISAEKTNGHLGSLHGTRGTKCSKLRRDH
jgi:hypothetical protein